MRIVFENVSKVFSSRSVLKSVSFSTDAKVIAVLGENAAGKSTLLKILATVLKPDSGMIKVNDIDIVRKPHLIRRILGYCPEVPALLDELTAVENLRLFASVKKTRVNPTDLTNMFKIPADLPVRKMSKGMKKRLSIAIALLNSPELLIMDEPTDELDEASRASLYTVLSDYKNGGRTIVFSSHRYEDLLLADYVVVLSNGEVVFHGNVDSLSSAGFYAVTIDKEDQKYASDFPALLNFDNKVTVLINEEELNNLLNRVRVLNLRRPTVYEFLKACSIKK